VGNYVGKVALVSGSASGLGAAVAAALAASGASVVGMDPANGDATGRDEEGVFAVQGDVTSTNDIERVFKSLLSRFGRLDLLVNNAGLMDSHLRVGEIDIETWDRVVAVNLTGQFLMAKSAIPVMEAQQAGVIINMSSVAGLFGSHAGVAYTVSKHGVIGLTKSIAAAYSGSGIRCIAVCPGATEHRMTPGRAKPSPEGAKLGALKLGLHPREVGIDEMVSLILFLGSAGSSSMNGATVVADAGWTAQ
jgi:NAD(P)-dependent dehydrogenase (short-subunit alcohol dehydrogenase family)